jgi:hypothetical protein
VEIEKKGKKKIFFLPQCSPDEPSHQWLFCIKIFSKSVSCVIFLLQMEKVKKNPRWCSIKKKMSSSSPQFALFWKFLSKYKKKIQDFFVCFDTEKGYMCTKVGPLEGWVVLFSNMKGNNIEYLNKVYLFFS